MRGPARSLVLGLVATLAVRVQREACLGLPWGVQGLIALGVPMGGPGGPGVVPGRPSGSAGGGTISDPAWAAWWSLWTRALTP